MKTSTTTTMLLKALDIELKKMIQQDLDAYRLAAIKKQSINQGAKQAA